jgi:GMP synthase-like glutamine amidotransferase
MHIGLLECDNVAGRFSHIEGGYREMFAALLPGARFSYYEAWKNELPASADACGAWVCTGSQYSVYDKMEWVGALSRLVQTLHEEKRPYVGICFGHQMLAQALGGEVARAARGWGVGVHDVQVLRQEPWMQPPQSHFRIHHMHADQVQRLPPDSVVLGSSAHCEVAMFRVGDSMLGIEGHPEFTAAFSEALIRARADRIGVERVQAGLASLGQPTDGAVVGRWIAQFLERKDAGSSV